MELKDIVAITGMSGLYKVVSNKSNGIVVTSLEDNKSSFVSARVHGITPIENISIYKKNDENEDIKKVLYAMLQQESTNPLVDAKASPEELKNYLRSILPDFDDERVHQSDIKKLVKWFHLLKAHDLIKPVEEEASESDNKEQEEAKNL